LARFIHFCRLLSFLYNSNCLKVVYTIPDHVEDTFFQRVNKLGHVAVRLKDPSLFNTHADADLFIDGKFAGNYEVLSAPLLIHAPANTWESIHGVPTSSARICAWPGFWQRTVWEYVPHPECLMDWKALLLNFGIEGWEVPDMAGLVAPRILTTIINEAVHTLADGIAGPEDIDTAMRLGTNYPRGPLDWGKDIGAGEINKLLQEMQKEDKRYAPHPALINTLL
jgi:hypothetical protein